MPFAAFQKYKRNILAGRAQNPKHVKLLRDSAVVSAGVALE